MMVTEVFKVYHPKATISCAMILHKLYEGDTYSD